MSHTNYIGRFAPSPTGPLHYGSMIAAIASFLQARAQQGQWLVRMEDLDTVRCIKGVDSKILKTLESFGLHWDGEVMYQSQRTAAYQQALTTLEQQALIYPCTCSRKQLIDETGLNSPIYPGTCKQLSDWSLKDYAVRLKVGADIIGFDDVVYGRQQQNLAQQVGDFVIKRRDNLFAYQLAVVVDDAAQGITEIVRGADLLDSTARQIYLQRCLQYASPGYCHLPLALDGHGHKLSKSSGAGAIKNAQPLASIISILAFLGQTVPPELSDASLGELWQYAIAHWNPEHIPPNNRRIS